MSVAQPAQGLVRLFVTLVRRGLERHLGAAVGQRLGEALQGLAGRVPAAAEALTNGGTQTPREATPHQCGEQADETLRRLGY